MKKKIKDLTIGELIHLARVQTMDCKNCPLLEFKEFECWRFCCMKHINKEFLEQEIEVKDDGSKN